MFKVQPRPVFLFCFAVMLLATAADRLSRIDDRVFSQDETTILEFTNGLLTTGSAALQRGETSVPMATYELLPPFIAVSSLVLGWSEYTVRLPALMFHLATLVLIFWAGCRWFNEWIALWAGGLYALSPWTFFWSTNCFYPSQAQFFSFLTTIFIFRLYHSKTPSPRDFYLAAGAMILTFFTWEASGLLLPVFLAVAVVTTKNKWKIATNPHAWIAGCLILCSIILQMWRRTLLRDPYLFIGSSRAEIASPQLAFLQPSFDPGYYLQNVFLEDPFLVASLLFVASLFFVRSNHALKFCVAMAAFYLIAFTYLLPVQGLRYLYLALPTYLLAAAASGYFLAEKALAYFSASPMGSYASALLIVPAAALLLFTHTGSLGIHNPFQTDQGDPAWELRPRSESVDFRSIASLLAREVRAEDVIITARGGFPLHLYSGLKARYSLQEITTSIVVYEPRRGAPFYSDKWVGSLVLNSQQQLQDVLDRHPRVWLFVAPTGVAEAAITAQTQKYVQENMVLKAESHNARLYLTRHSQ